MKQKIFSIVILCLMVLLLAGCSSQSENKIEGGLITGVTLDESGAGQNANFELSSQTDGQGFGLEFWGAFTEGGVSVQVINQATREIVFTREASGTTSLFNEVITLAAGDYDLLVAWTAPVKGSYSLEWEPGQVERPEITPMILVSGVGMLLVGLGFLFFGARAGGWKYALLGGAFWAGTVVVKFILAGLFNNVLYQWVGSALPGLPGTILFSIYVGLLTGITEVLITWLILKNTKFGQRVWKEILSFSIGFGAIEAVLLGLLGLVNTIAVLSMSDQLAAYQLRNAAMGNNLVYSFAPILERFFTIGVHYGCNLLLFYSVLKNQKRWFWYSFALKSGIDAVAGYAQLSGQLESLTFLWIIEGFVVLFGIIGYWVANRVGKKIQEMQPQEQTEIVSA
jgi:uncharacterized membrane protein YhfC